MIVRSLLIVSLALAGCSIGGNSAKPPATAEEWAALSQPSANHALLNPLEGTFHVKISFWSHPSEPPQESEGTSTLSWVLGRRFLEERLTGIAGRQSFDGFGMYGYDNATGRFLSLWADSMNTALVSSSGTYEPKDKTFRFSGEVFDPLKSETKLIKTELQIVSPDDFLFVLYDQGPKGVIFKAVEMIYKRKTA